ncbi:MAG: ketoacyl-ACP synthase III [Acidobacteria bacterium]|nr:ketoacyl-ACP synthase III [Acidobacteriota bacterium]
MTRYAKIVGTGSYVPEKMLTNDDLSQMLGEDINTFVSQVVGIERRHFCSDKENTTDLAVEAGRRAIKMANLKAEDIDLIILATDTPAYISPATSTIVQYCLGAKNAGSFDVNCACAGFVTALKTAATYIMGDPEYKNILVIGAYAMSKYLDWDDKKTCTIFADGAGAVVLQASDTPGGYLASKLYADGQYHNYLGIFAGGTAMPITKNVLREGKHNKVRFLQKYPPEINMEGWPNLVKETLKKANVDIKDVKQFFFTQVNLSTIKAVMQNLELPMSLAHTIMGKWGYTGSACIPMALDDAATLGKIQKDDLVLMCASGGGLNMACAVFRWSI